MRQRQARPRLLQAMIDAFSLPDLRRRILITLGILVIFRFVAHVPLPGIDLKALEEMKKRPLKFRPFEDLLREYNPGV